MKGITFFLWSCCILKQTQNPESKNWAEKPETQLRSGRKRENPGVKNGWKVEQSC